MTAAMTKALELHTPVGSLPRFPTEEERAAWIALNARRTSITNDDWPMKIAAFRALFNLAQYNRPTPGLLLGPREGLQRSMLAEEYNEINEAWANRNLPEIVDGLLDLIYVAMGTLAELGLRPQQINLLMEEVHASNMTKTDDEGKPIYSEEGKVLKGPNYVRADIAKLLLDMGWQPEETDNG